MSKHARGHVAMRWIILFGVIDTLAVTLRFFIRRRHRIRLGADDWLILASLLPAYAMIILAGFCRSPLPDSVEQLH